MRDDFIVCYSPFSSVRGCVIRLESYQGPFHQSRCQFHALTNSSGPHDVYPIRYDPFEPLIDGTCVITKLYTAPCTIVVTSIQAWTAWPPQFQLRMGGSAACVNSGSGTTHLLCSPTPNTTWPTPIRCAWTRIVEGRECLGL